MITKSIKKFLILLGCGISMECSAANFAAAGFEEKENVVPNRKYGHIPDAGRKSLAHLRTMSVQHMDENHPHIQTLQAAAPLPASGDLTAGYPNPFDQGQLGSCTSNALIGAVLYELIKQGKVNPANCAGPANGTSGSQMLSRLMLYYDERSIEGDTSHDNGAALADGIYSLFTQGTCLESLWRYSDNATQFAVKPTTACYTQAKLYEETALATSVIGSEASSIASLATDLVVANTASVALNLITIKTLLNAHCPVVCGILAYPELESAIVAGPGVGAGIVSMPTAREKSIGGHAIAFAGWNDNMVIGSKTGAFLMRNSWGTSWGTHGASGPNGYFWLPYDYIMAYASDLWKVGSITFPAAPAPTPTPTPSNNSVLIAQLQAQIVTEQGALNTAQSALKVAQAAVIADQATVTADEVKLAALQQQLAALQAASKK